MDRNKQERPDAPDSTCVSMSHRSIGEPLTFTDGRRLFNQRFSHRKPDVSGPSCVSMKSDHSAGHPLNFRDRVDQETSETPSAQSVPKRPTDLDCIFMLLEENIVTFVRSELQRFLGMLNPDYTEPLEKQRDAEDEEQRRSSREAFLSITLHFLRTMKQEELAECLHSSKRTFRT